MVATYQGRVQDGELRFTQPPQLPEGAQVVLIVVEADQPKPGLTLGALLDSPLVGMWADREDITESAEFARQLRERASRRQG